MQCSAGIASSARHCENICAAGNSSRQHASSQVDPASCGCNLGRKSPPPLEATARSRVIRRTFDIPTMARLSVGSSWATLSEGQRQQVIESFGRYISAIYADRFDSYAGQKLQVTREQPAAAGLMVMSRIIKANGEPVNVDYVMRHNGDTW